MKEEIKLSIWKKIIILDVISVIAAYYLVNYLDILTTDYKWIQWMKQYGLLHIYDSWDIEMPVDYPPLYLVWLYMIRNMIGEVLSNYTQLVMKTLPLAVEFLAQIFIYKKISPEAAWKWSVNAALLVNIVIYGQRDGMIGFLIVLLFYYMKKEKWFEPAIVVTVFCLLKPQGIYFIFILLLYYYAVRIQAKRLVIAAFSSLGLGYLVFLPFAITSGDYLIAIKLYMYEFSIHKVFGSVAGNLWGIFEYWPLPPIIEHLSTLLLFGCMLIGIYVYKKTNDYLYASLVYMISVFMLTVSQHGRYTIYSMFIVFVALYIYDEVEYKKAYLVITISTTVSQVGMLLYNRIIVNAYGLELINKSVEMTYSMLYKLYFMRYLAIVCTLILNIIFIVLIVRVKRKEEDNTITDNTPDAC